MRLLLLHPKVAFRNCQHCLKFEYNEETGKPEPDVRRKKVNGQHPPLPRVVTAPCRKDGCPKGTAENPVELTPQNMRAYSFDQECKAVVKWPDDPIVRRNAAIIRSIDELAEQLRQEEMKVYLAKLAIR